MATGSLSIADLHAYYGLSHVLQGVTLDVRPAEILGLIGRNGMGKTTTVRATLGLCDIRAGRITFDGTELVGMRTYEIARQGIGWVPQGRHVFDELTVRENLLVAARGSRWNLERIYATFPSLQQRDGQLAGTLSGGEQQLLAIGRALMVNPSLLILDEPSEGLAPLAIDAVATVIEALKEAGTTMVLIEQNIRLAFRLSDRVAIMSKGRIVHTSTPAELGRNEAVLHEYLAFGT
jgi:branched-chain amino acid transport system ATP-binding protein